MRFLNIYPLRILATLRHDGVFEGQFIFNVEQYGLMFQESVCDVTFSPNPLSIDEWQLQVQPISAVEIQFFDKFVAALNHYLFEVLCFTPNKYASGSELPSIKLFFDDIYFDLSGDEPRLAQIKKS
jgi:hypothetical protein